MEEIVTTVIGGAIVGVLGWPFYIGATKPEDYESLVKVYAYPIAIAVLVAVGYAFGFQQGGEGHEPASGAAAINTVAIWTAVLGPIYGAILGAYNAWFVLGLVHKKSAARRLDRD